MKKEAIRNRIEGGDGNGVHSTDISTTNLIL